jgi:hypothetical protein
MVLPAVLAAYALFVQTRPACGPATGPNESAALGAEVLAAGGQYVEAPVSWAGSGGPG